MYSLNSVFLALLNLVTQNQRGYVVLHSCIERLWNDPDAIASFYADRDFNETDPEYVGMDAWEQINIALDSVGLVLPPEPGTTDDPFALMPDGTSYADPAAANAALQASLMSAKSDPEALAAVQAEPFHVDTNIDPVAEVPVAADQTGDTHATE